MSDQQPTSVVIINLYDEFSHHVWIEKTVRNMLEAQGDLVEGVDYDVVAGYIDDPKLRDTGDDASGKQLWFLGKCLTEAMPYQDDSVDLAIAIDIARQEMRGTVSKSRASSLIDALKELREECQAIRTSQDTQAD
jgi:hypothetical protein